MGPACCFGEWADAPQAQLHAAPSREPEGTRWAAVGECIEGPNGDTASGFDIATYLGAGQTMTPELDMLYRLWAAKCAGGALPGRGDFTFEDLAPWLGHLVLVDVIDGGADFTYRVFGTQIAEYLGHDLTGKRLSALAPPLQRALGEEYRGVLAARRPHYVVGSPFLSRRFTIAARAILPLSYSGCAVDQLLIGFYHVGARA